MNPTGMFHVGTVLKQMLLHGSKVGVNQQSCSTLAIENKKSALFLTA